MQRSTAILKVIGLCLVSLVVGMSTISAQEAANGKVTLESKSVAIGIGVSWGDGILEYKGKKYPFTVEGLSVVDLGVSKVSARGDVHNLAKVQDFEGTYTAAGAGGYDVLRGLPLQRGALLAVEADAAFLRKLPQPVEVGGTAGFVSTRR